ncbi:MAG TPA: isoaspartyl peptidase/L-asparaginase family protein [Sphingopyxis sp.]|uniref:isoaspartyl peptidase/L-asparaginase family protein n=1 Tax=Sphingopyxis sp. TaxID=1908224 RepID=UPI002BB50DF5|nr:isoaspartyl peptidase/L-asparaginase family protein [Sphingopyxis sp.]HWW55501.1 isoaspartyl peptidase/L-asparaginase family protein [Sphingopyxis sp.]
MDRLQWVIVVHGGAKTIAPDKAVAHRSGCARAVEAGAEILRRGGSALDAARRAVCVLEDDPTFNAGRGSVRNAAGEIEMDAAIMDGETLAIGAVAAVRHVANPIEAAAALLDTPPILLVGKGAERFARDAGLCPAGPEIVSVAAGDPGHDTVGCVALDRAGHVAAATSTGGLEGTLPGRVGDSPLPGCGFYADDAIGGVSLSGDGEAIGRTLLGARVMRAMEREPADEAVTVIFAPMERLAAEAGVIAIDATGQIGIAHNSDHFALACASSAFPEVVSAIHQNELREEKSNV